MDSALLESIKQKDFALPEGQSRGQLTQQLLLLLGSADGHLRDSLALEILWAWIARAEYGRDELVDMVERLLNNLRRGLGQSGDDSVFLRSFSALVLSVIVAADNRRAENDPSESLGAATIRRIFNAGLTYFEAEADWRGYLPKQGWAHAIAHCADLFWRLSASRHLEAEELRQMLQVVKHKLHTLSDSLLLAEEDERLARAASQLIGRGLLSEAELQAWLGELAQSPVAGTTWRQLRLEPRGAVAYLNTKNFLRSLYFQLRDKPLADEVVEAIACLRR